MGPSGSTRSSISPRTIPAIGVLIATWLLMWLAQGVPTVCALAYPCPADDVRVTPALTFGGLMLVPAAVLFVTSLIAVFVYHRAAVFTSGGRT